VRRVKVVEGKYERPHQRGGSKEGGRCVEQAETRSFGVTRQRGRQIAVELVELREKLREIRRSPAELVAEQLGIRVRRVRSHRLHPRPVGRCTTGLPAAADEHLGAPLPSVPSELLDEAALTDARLAADQEETTLAGQSVVETAE